MLEARWEWSSAGRGRPGLTARWFRILDGEAGDEVEGQQEDEEGASAPKG
jgi:hypothetical protein